MQEKNLLDLYLEYTEPHEARTIYHKWCIISTVASIISGRCWTRLGFGKLDPNLFIVLAGPPGIPRKTAALRTMQDVFLPLIPESYLQVSTGSPASTRELLHLLEKSELNCTVVNELEEFEDQPYMTFMQFSSELSNFIKQKDTEFSNMLLELFDGSLDFKRSTFHHGSTEVRNASLNILAATTNSFFEEISFREHIKSGLSSRFIFIYLDDRRGNYPDPDFDLELKKKIQDRLFKLSKVTGYIPFSEKAKKVYLDWYSTQPTKATGKMNKNTLSYIARKQTYVRKLCLILFAMDYVREGSNMASEVFPIQVERAIELVNEVEGYMMCAYGKSGRSPDSEDINDILVYFQSRPGEWVSKQELIHRFMKDMRREVLESLLTILSTEMDALETKMMSGRPIYLFKGLREPKKIKKEDVK
jgi:hypothetical protein